MSFIFNLIFLIFCLAIGMYLRFSEWHYLNKMYYFSAFIPIVILFIVCLFLTLRSRTTKKDFKKPLLYFWGLIILVSMTAESEEENREKQIKFLRRHVGIVNDYIKVHGQSPENFSVAFEYSNKTLPNRGDADGKGLVYKKIGKKEFIFISVGPNGLYEEGGGDDIIVKSGD